MSEKGKRGPWSSDEKLYIESHYHRLTPKEIAVHLRRDEKSVERYIKEGCHSQTYKIARTAEDNLQDSPVWDDIKVQFNDKEQEMFLHHWGRIVSQFRDDVFPTEEWQIVDAIKLELLMNRLLTKQGEMQKDISDLEKRYNDERDKVPPDRDRIDRLERQIGILRGGLVGITSEYRELLNKKNNILKEMKATRDARVKDIESSKQSWSGLVRRIIEDKDMRVRLGEEMEKMRLAANVEYQKLTDLHTYCDGEVDQPILNSDSIMKIET